MRTFARARMAVAGLAISAVVMTGCGAPDTENRIESMHVDKKSDQELVTAGKEVPFPAPEVPGISASGGKPESSADGADFDGASGIGTQPGRSPASHDADTAANTDAGTITTQGKPECSGPPTKWRPRGITVPSQGWSDATETLKGLGAPIDTNSILGDVENLVASDLRIMNKGGIQPNASFGFVIVMTFSAPIADADIVGKIGQGKATKINGRDVIEVTGDTTIHYYHACNNVLVTVGAPDGTLARQVL